jgi:hypothetical protein
VVDDQLAAPLEQVEQGRLSIGAFEHVGLVDLHHRQPPAIGVQRIARPGEILLFGEQLLARDEPVVS